MSAGVIGTPHILLLSGIGSQTDLQAVGINTTLNLPSVGKNFHDQPGVIAPWSTTSNNTAG